MFDIFWFLRRDRPTPRQRAYLRDLGVWEKPRTKQGASTLINQVIGHWEDLFSEHFKGWYSAPREITRPLFIFAKKSPVNAFVAAGQAPSPDQVDNLAEAAIGPECVELLKRDLDQFDVSNGLHYIELYAQAAEVSSRSPLYHSAILGALCQAKLFRQVCDAGHNIQTAWDEDVPKILRRKNKLNAALEDLLKDRSFRKRIERLNAARGGAG